MRKIPKLFIHCEILYFFGLGEVVGTATDYKVIYAGLPGALIDFLGATRAVAGFFFSMVVVSFRITGFY